MLILLRPALCHTLFLFLSISDENWTNNGRVEREPNRIDHCSNKIRKEKKGECVMTEGDRSMVRIILSYIYTRIYSVSNGEPFLFCIAAKQRDPCCFVRHFKANLKAGFFCALG